MVQPQLSAAPPYEWLSPVPTGDPPAAELAALLTMLAHDIRSPLHTIGLSCELLSARADPTDPAAARQLDIIRYTVAQIDRLVGDVLSMAASEGGADPFRAIGTRVAAVLAEAAADHRALAEVHGVSLSVTAPGPDCRVAADRASVLRVLANLISNAVRYTPAGGSIALAARPLGDMVEFTVRDSGRGLTLEQLRRVLEQAPLSPPVSRRHGGVGLWIVRRIVELHGGCVSVDSSVGRGSSFTFQLPSTHVTICRAMPTE
jgi:signal transduction histidine kinase